MSAEQAKPTSHPAPETLATASQLGALLDGAATLVGLKNLEHQYLFANRKLELLYGASPGGLVGSSLELHVAPENIREIHVRESDVIRSGKPAFFVENITINGQKHIWEAIRFPFRDPAGNIAGSGFVAIDASGSAELVEEKRKTLELAHQQTADFIARKTASPPNSADASNHPPPDDKNARPEIVKITWNKSHECGNSAIDRQHRMLFESMSQLLTSVLSHQPKTEVTQAIANLLAELKQHFHDEESILRQAFFPHVNEHSRIHAQMLAKANELAKLYAEDQLQLGDMFCFLANDVVARHMLEEDRKFFAFIDPHFPLEPES